MMRARQLKNSVCGYAMHANGLLHSVLVIGVAFLLVSCGAEKGDDLDQFMADASNDMRVKIEPIPEVKPYTPVEYNPDGTLHDPFKARKAQSNQSGGLQPNMNRPREPLEAYPLESLKYVGILSKAKLKYALLQPPDNVVQEAKIGSYLGQNFGVVTEITENAVMLKEIVQDDATGDWVERSTSINLQE